MIFWHKIVIFHTKYRNNFRAFLRNWKKIWFFGVKSWFFTRNTPKMFAPPSVRVMEFNVTLKQYVNYMVAISFIGNNPQYPKKTTNLPQVTEYINHIWLYGVMFCRNYLSLCWSYCYRPLLFYWNWGGGGGGG